MVWNDVGVTAEVVTVSNAPSGTLSAGRTDSVVVYISVNLHNYV